MLKTAPQRSIEQQQPIRLHEIPSNPIPSGATVGCVVTNDGVELRYARWEAALRPSKGTVLLLHGRTEFIEKHFEAVNDLRSRGFGVLSFDWRGQGGSTRLLRDPKKGHVENFNQYLMDLETILTEIALPDCKPPFYIVAHSTGALVSLMAAPLLRNRVRRMVLVSPLLALADIPVPQGTLQKILGILTFLGAGKAYLKYGKAPEQRPFISNRLTSDTQRFQRKLAILQAAPELAIGAPTIAWMFAACRAMAQVNAPGFSNAISIPTLLVAAGSDKVVSPAAIEKFGKSMRSGAFLTISGAKHELLDERDVFRQQLFAAFDAFVPGSEI